MKRISEVEAVEAGLSVIGPDGVPRRETPTEVAERCARHANDLAAVVEDILRRGQVTARTLRAVRDSLGELHVELELLAEELATDGLKGAA